MYEKRLKAVAAQSFTVGGNATGTIKIADTRPFKVKQIVYLIANTLEPLELEIKRIDDMTTMYVGPKEGNIDTRSDISAYTTALNAAVFANEQLRSKIPEQEIERLTYEEEPTVARRVVNVDPFGNKYDVDNPFPVQLSDGSIDIGTVNAELEVQLSRRDNYPDAGDVHDSVRIGNQNYEVSLTPNDDETKVGFDINTLNKLIDIPHDDIEVVQFTSDGDPEIIEIREGGNVKRTLTLTYNADGEFQRVVRS